jgi:hypothetical protein
MSHQQATRIKHFRKLACNFLEAGMQLFFDAHTTFWKLASNYFLTRTQLVGSWHANFFFRRPNFGGLDGIQ